GGGACGRVVLRLVRRAVEGHGGRHGGEVTHLALVPPPRKLSLPKASQEGGRRQGMLAPVFVKSQHPGARLPGRTELRANRYHANGAVTAAVLLSESDTGQELVCHFVASRIAAIVGSPMGTALAWRRNVCTSPDSAASVRT